MEKHEATERILVDTLGFRGVEENGSTKRYSVGDGGPGTFVDVRAIGGSGEGSNGAGTVHHVAFAAPDDETQLEIQERARSSSMYPTPVIDRSYFRSVYFREPGGVLAEIATNSPGFTIDEPFAQLGQSLKLPPQHESRREEIEAILPPIHMPGSITASLRAEDEADLWGCEFLPITS